MALPGTATIAALSARRSAAAEAVGRRAVEIAVEDLRPSAILTPAAFDNAITMLAAIGGSTNAVVHLLALARRTGYELPLERFDEISQRTPVLADVRPAGAHLVEQLDAAGGVPAVLHALGELIDPSAPTIAGRPIGEAARPATGPGRADARRSGQAGRRPGRPAGVARAPRRGAQGRLRRPVPAPPPRPCRRLRGRRRRRRAHRRRDARDRSVVGARTPRRRPEGRARDARVGHGADPRAAARGGRAGHGAGVRRAHVGHRVRHLRAARRARVVRGRSACGGPRRRPDRARCRAPHARAGGRPGRGRSAGSPSDRRRRPGTPAATAGCTSTTCSRPTRAATSTSSPGRPRRGGRCPTDCSADGSAGGKSVKSRTTVGFTSFSSLTRFRRKLPDADRRRAGPDPSDGPRRAGPDRWRDCSTHVGEPWRCGVRTIARGSSTTARAAAFPASRRWFGDRTGEPLAAARTDAERWHFPT